MTRKVKVLVVEDETFVAKDVEMQLEELGYDVCQIVKRSDETLRAMEIHQPDLILMDINIDGPYDGIETAQKVKQSYDIPIIFLTDLRDQETFERAKKVGPALFLNKPFNEYELSRHIDLAIYNASVENVSEWRENSNHLLKEFIWIKVDHSYKKKPLSDVLWIKADGAYCEVVTAEGSHKLSKNMREVNDLIDGESFIKIHKSYIVNIEKVDEINGGVLIINKQKIPIGKTFLQPLKERLKFI